MKKIMKQKITQNNWNFWTVNLIMRAKKIVNQSSDFPVRRTVTKKALANSLRWKKCHVLKKLSSASHFTGISWNTVHMHTAIGWLLLKMNNSHDTQTHLMAFSRNTPRWAGIRKVKPIWILLKEETVSGSGINWVTGSRSRHLTTPAPTTAGRWWAGGAAHCPPHPLSSVTGLQQRAIRAVLRYRYGHSSGQTAITKARSEHPYWLGGRMGIRPVKNLGVVGMGRR